jgi:hypothetical protein
MNDMKPIDSPTIRLHKRQVAWQILIPFLLVALMLLAAGVGLVWGETARARVWADVSIIWIIVPLLLLTLVAIALLAALIVGMIKLLQIAPRYTLRAQQVVGQVSAGARKVADGATEPFIWIKQAGAVVKSIFKIKR